MKLNRQYRALLEMAELNRRLYPGCHQPLDSMEEWLTAIPYSMYILIILNIIVNALGSL